MGDLISQYKSIIEGLIFAADEPLTPDQLNEFVGGEDNPGVGNSNSKLSPAVISSIIEELNKEYKQTNKPYQILQLAGGYIFSTVKDISSYVGRLRKEQARRRLTQAALETLAIIAYKQPITRNDVETIRGVNSDYILRSLMEKDLVTIVGRGQSVGRPLLYGTTRRFLQHFGLNSLNELPKPREIEELIGETEREVEKRLLQMEKERMMHEDEIEQRQRSRKPHPISEQAVAKIIPLKPDYRPKRRDETVEQTSIETHSGPLDNIENKIAEEIEDKSTEFTSDEEKPVEAQEKKTEEESTTGETEESEIVGTEKATEQKTKASEAEIETQDVDEMRVDEVVDDETKESDLHDAEISEKERIPKIIQSPVDERAGEKKATVDDEQIIEKQESAWKRWKNKIASIIKKIFG